MEENKDENNIEQDNVEQPTQAEPVKESEPVFEPDEDNEVRAETIEEKQEPKNDRFGNLTKKLEGKLPSFSFKLNWDVKTWPHKIMHTLREYKRVILVSKKPDIEELSEISKIAGIGILLMGFIGFILQTLFKLIVG